MGNVGRQHVDLNRIYSRWRAASTDEDLDEAYDLALHLTSLLAQRMPEPRWTRKEREEFRLWAWNHGA